MAKLIFANFSNFWHMLICLIWYMLICSYALILLLFYSCLIWYMLICSYALILLLVRILTQKPMNDQAIKQSYELIELCFLKGNNLKNSH